jgi:hypothetical protein
MYPVRVLHDLGFRPSFGKCWTSAATGRASASTGCPRLTHCEISAGRVVRKVASPNRR